MAISTETSQKLLSLCQLLALTLAYALPPSQNL